MIEKGCKPKIWSQKIILICACNLQLDGEFLWDKDLQGKLHSSFFVGYITQVCNEKRQQLVFFFAFRSQIVGGQLATIVGGRAVVGAAILVGALVTLLSPIAARMHVYVFFGLRAMLGVTQGKSGNKTHNTNFEKKKKIFYNQFLGAVFPALQQMWSVWAPPHERSLLTGITFAGAQVGNGRQPNFWSTKHIAVFVCSCRDAARRPPL